MLFEHRQRSWETVDALAYKRLQSVQQLVAARAKIYLDLNFWLWLRDASLGKRSDPDLVQLLSLLRGLVGEGAAICPIGTNVFSEVLKQTDRTTQSVTAQLIDELSGGISVIPSDLRMADEVRLAVTIFREGRRDVTAPSSIPMFTRIGHAIGFSPGEIDRSWPEREGRNVLKKTMFDELWAL